ncbi:biotin transporter BioY [Cellulomonas uda]|uniref:Biotin transporter n=1 Tax=Cellulomonas uda TaxID=1714 RepID=A0A4Y3KAP1_CELUD|nr:biotin transport system substrate-specific component [Cellulomonas uda]GEA81073.1 hypothetical protein CUD01_15170 [Cellulomonas uda]
MTDARQHSAPPGTAIADAPQSPALPDPAAVLDVALPEPAERAHPATADVALVAVFAAFIAVCAVVPGIPTGTGVPVTLQTFGVVLAGLVLGWRRGALAVLLYLAVGLAGVPVFSGGTGGLAVLAGPSVGYLLGFPLAAALAGVLASAARKATGPARYLVLVASGLTATALTVHPLGIAGIVLRTDLTAGEAFAAGAVFFPGDTVKTLLAAAVALAVFAAYPDLLRRRR